MIGRTLGFAGYPNDGGPAPDDVQLDCGANRCVVMITDRFLADDSARAEQIRVEFARTGELWVLDWAGARCSDTA
ncbi:MAG: hypothetical protein HKN74_09370 [Acidimicrobiia bacterium]|nr:hypothetical protein [Acidimicrobiia bacterium]